MSRRALRPVILIVATLLAAARVGAHPLAASYSEFTVRDRTIEGLVRLPLDDADVVIELDRNVDGKITPAELEEARADIESYLRAKVHVAADGSPLTIELHAVGTWKDRQGNPYLEAAFRGNAAARIESVAIGVEVLTDVYASHKNLAQIRFAERTDQFVFENGRAYSGAAAHGSFWKTAASFLALGIEHIFTGYDHILFLFGLLLVGSRFRDLVKIVTSFTAAHSTTLALATLGIVQPLAWTIEAAIALSIAYVGFENLVIKDVRHRWKITLVFGLVHGFGFANVLREMHLPRAGLVASLTSFNLGVEVGQIVIVALMLPVIQWIARTRYRLLVTRTASILIIAIGLFWFYQRIV